MAKLSLYERDMAIIHTLYNLMRAGDEPTVLTNQMVADLAEQTISQVRDVTKIIESLGILKRTYFYPVSDTGTIAGRQWKWSLLMKEADATHLYSGRVYNFSTHSRSRLVHAGSIHPERPSLSTKVPKPKGKPGRPRKELANGIDPEEETAVMLETVEEVVKARVPASTREFTSVEAAASKSVTIANDPAEITRAIAGPNRKGPFEVLRTMRKPTDAQALVEAARQYRDRDVAMRTAIDNMVATAEKMGILIDRAAVEASAKYEVDPHLAPIAEVVPFVDSLEATIARQADQILELRRRTEGFENLRNERNRLARTNERLLAQQVLPSAMRES